MLQKRNKIFCNILDILYYFLQFKIISLEITFNLTVIYDLITIPLVL